MNMDEYQKLAHATAIYPSKGSVGGLIYTSLGLGEAGEFQNQVKKVLRDDKGIVTAERRQKLIDELGDILWYVSNCASELGVGLDSVAEGNIDKLASRQRRGTLGGSGDGR
jgi:NTP pyrophosphatase (non-canonical NTP hydrolase)